MNVIQEAEGERGAWLPQCCREPPHAKKLDARRELFSRFPAVAVMNANGCNSRDVEEGEVYGIGRHCAAFVETVTKLVLSTEIKYRGPDEEFTGPLLEGDC